MVYRSVLIMDYEFALDVIKDMIIEDVLADLENTDNIRFNQEICNEIVRRYIADALQDVDLVVLVDSGLIVSNIETLVKLYSVEGFLRKVISDIDYEDVYSEIEKRARGIELNASDDLGIPFKSAVVLSSQDYNNIVSKIEKDVILKIADRLDDGEFGISDSLLYSLVNKAVLKNLGDINFVVLTENEVINSDIKIPIIVYSIDKFCDKIVNEIYDSVKSRFKFKNDSEVYKDIEIEEDDYDTSYSMKL